MTHRVIMRSAPLAWAVALALAAGCDTAPPEIVERAVVTDTAIEEGPYEVRVTLHDISGIGSARLFHAGGGALSDAVDMIPMVAGGEDPVRPRYVGWIPGYPLGTEVVWGLELCDTRGNCRVDPPLYPLDGYRFRVGLVPSRPEIVLVAPDRGPSSGGTRVVIDGDDFRPGAEVRFGLEPADHVEFIDGRRVVARAPAQPAGTVDVVVRNPDTMEAFAADAYTYYPAPEVSSVTPGWGPTAGGTVVAITGQHFVEGVRAFFDGVPCRHLSILSETQLSCDTPPGAAGLVDVEVRDTGTGVGTLEEAFEYIAPPLVDRVDPDRGTDLGGTVIEVTGENFDEGAVVVVGGVPCSNTVWIDDTLLLCTVAPNTPGIVDVVVLNEDGQTATMIGGFNYLGPPVVVQVLPPLGPILGGVEVRIIGAGFTDTMQVFFGGAQAFIIDVIDDLEILVELPPSTLPLFPAPASGLASVDVLVQNTDPSDMRSDMVEDGFSYIWPPEVFSVDPPQGPTEGGTPVTITGRFFRQIPPAPIEVFFGEAEASSVAVLSSTTISAVTPPGPPGFVDVTVRNYENSEGTLPDGYLYIPPPEVIDVEPGVGPTFGGDRVTIIGEFFQPGAVVIFEGVGACTEVVFISSTELECTTPPAPGPMIVDVHVINPDGQEGEGLQLYEYVPVVVDPDFGLEAGFTRVRIVAAGIQNGVTIRFGDTIATDCTRLSSTEVICQSPPRGAPGFVDVGFLNPDGTGDGVEDGFEYRRFQRQTDDRLQSGGSGSNDVEVEDVDGDGDLDMVVANGQAVGEGQEPDWLYLNDGAGFFDRFDLPPGPNGFFTSNSADFGNLNDDALPDLVIGISERGGSALYENLGGGNFAFRASPPGVPDLNTGAFDAELVDLVGDGRDDLLVLTIGCSNDEENIPGLCDTPDSGADLLYERTGNNTWVNRSNFVPHDLGLVHDHKIADPDLDGDGDRDLVLFVDNQNFPGAANEHRVLYNRVNEGLGFVEDRTPFVGLVGDVFGVTYGDIDGDGDPDIIAGNCGQPFGSSEVVYFNQGGTLVRSFTSLPNETFDCDWGVLLFDVDNDDDLDLAFATERGNEFFMKLYVNDGDGNFFASYQSLPPIPNDLPLNTIGSDLGSGDFDGDGDLDLAVTAIRPEGFAFGDGTVELLMLVSEND